MASTTHSITGLLATVRRPQVEVAIITLEIMGLYWRERVIEAAIIGLFGQPAIITSLVILVPFAGLCVVATFATIRACPAARIVAILSCAFGLWVTVPSLTHAGQAQPSTSTPRPDKQVAVRGNILNGASPVTQADVLVGSVWTSMNDAGTFATTTAPTSTLTVTVKLEERMIPLSCTLPAHVQSIDLTLNLSKQECIVEQSAGALP